MMNRLFVLIVFLFIGLQSIASPYNEWWQHANRLYSAKQYDSAAYYFEKIAALQPQEATIYYNLGNTYYKLNKIGPAVLNYERALKIEPGNKKVADNLSLTQSRIANRIPTSEDIFFVRWWQSITAGSYATTWAVISLLFFLAIIAGLIMKRLGKSSWAGPRAVMILSAVWLVTMILSFSSAASRDSQEAVVMQNDTPLMNNTRQGKALGYLPEGTTVAIQSHQAEWMEIRLPDGRTGWVQQNTLTRI